MPSETLPVAEFAFPGPLRDSAGRPVAVIETTAVREIRLVVAQAFRVVPSRRGISSRP
jgi:hypothetical protein